jgi:hypothetical protein
MAKEKIISTGFTDGFMGDYTGNWNPWFISDLICLLDGEISCEAKHYIEATTYDGKKRIGVYTDSKKFICFTSHDYQYTRKDFLAFEGFCNKFDLKFEEWCDE